MKNKIDTTPWSRAAGKMLGQISAVWFALTIAAILFTVPTKLIFWLIGWFWSLF